MNLEELRNGLVHADSGDGIDYTLCGITAENIVRRRDYGAERETEAEPCMAWTRSKITCPRCAAIIRYSVGLGLKSIGEVAHD